MKIAIIDSNRLSGMGLQHLLGEIIPMAELAVFTSYEELSVSEPEEFVHFFVSSGIFFEHMSFFQQQKHPTIVMVQGDNFPHIKGLLTLNVCQDEAGIAQSLLALRQRGHGVQQVRCSSGTIDDLSQREMEVAVLLARGLMNKEVAERLNISLTTVISHRKKIMEKLGARSLADIIVWVVTRGVVSMEELAN